MIIQFVKQKKSAVMQKVRKTGQLFATILEKKYCPEGHLQT